ncbi:hypothetical protein [Streptomyces sp. NPDC020951]|uniref:hypothetical protein n=1 Tax=Streptomyces sp. NPDC020951 TaxID=3365104 RepID=UPI0037AF10C2
MDLMTVVLVVLGVLLPSVVEVVRSVADRNRATAQRIRASGEAEVMRAKFSLEAGGDAGAQAGRNG